MVQQPSNKGAGGKIDLSQLDAMARTAKVGRREPPEPDDPRKSRWVLLRGLLLGALVVAVVLAIIFIVNAVNPGRLSV